MICKVLKIGVNELKDLREEKVRGRSIIVAEWAWNGRAARQSMEAATRAA
jgi:hypothetical protein